MSYFSYNKISLLTVIVQAFLHISNNYFWLILAPFGSDYERGVRELLAENGQSPDSSGPLTWEDKKAFERAMLDLQISIESQVITLLDDEQVAALPDAVPVVLIFKNGGDQSIIERNAPSF